MTTAYEIQEIIEYCERAGFELINIETKCQVFVVEAPELGKYLLCFYDLMLDDTIGVLDDYTEEFNSNRVVIDAYEQYILENIV